MTPLSALPDRLDVSAESVEAFRRAVAQLPPDALPELLARVEAGIEHAERTGDLGPLRHLFDSVVMTARLHDNGAYVRAAAVADAEDERGRQEPVEVADFVRDMRVKYGD